MTYIIRHTASRIGYVARPGLSRAYVLSPLDAQEFPTRGEAEAARCSFNEVVEEVRGTYTH